MEETTSHTVEQYSALFKYELKQELNEILRFWMDYTIDSVNGGFIGRIDQGGNVYPEAPKGSVLNSRILWTFSAAYNSEKKPEYLLVANRSFSYLIDFFYDKEYGGVYWSVDYKGQPLDTKKQIYALSFAVYGLSEYYIATSNEEARSLAIKLYEDIVKYSFDQKHGGYIEALSRDWNLPDDFRLSSKDANEKKSMNTHLHVLEGFANLYRIYPDQLLKKKITELIHYFLDHIIDPVTHHLILFFDDKWTKKSDSISYGHDIEAAWLVQEAAEIIAVDRQSNNQEQYQSNQELLKKVQLYSVQMAEAAARGLDTDGGLWYEKDSDTGHLVKEKHWWPQAEAMVGFFNAFQLTNDQKFMDHSLNSWHFIRKYIKAPNGEWYWGIHENYTSMSSEDKVGIWKCPYHNGRACIELIKRVNLSVSA
jgi:mannobiose 2-epimerase